MKFDSWFGSVLIVLYLIFFLKFYELKWNEIVIEKYDYDIYKFF